MALEIISAPELEEQATVDFYERQVTEKESKRKEATMLNPVQLHLLRMFSYNRDEASLVELKDVLFNYYCQRVNEEGKRVWKEKNMSNQTMNELLNTHVRTPYP